MNMDIIFVDGAYILFVVAGALLLSGLQCCINSSYVYRLTKKVGPEYWGTVDGKPGQHPSESTISLYKPAPEVQSSYGKRS